MGFSIIFQFIKNLQQVFLSFLKKRINHVATRTCKHAVQFTGANRGKLLTHSTASTPRECSWMSKAPSTVSRWDRFLASSSPLLLINSHSWVIWPGRRGERRLTGRNLNFLKLQCLGKKTKHLRSSKTFRRFCHVTTTNLHPWSEERLLSKKQPVSIFSNSGTPTSFRSTTTNQSTVPEF